MPRSTNETLATGAASATPAMLPHSLHAETTLVSAGQPLAAVVYPHDDDRYRLLAAKVASAIAGATGVMIESLPDNDVLPRRGVPVPDSFRRRPLVLLGNLNSNRLVSPLYARDHCATDATYPGRDGYDLRTCIHPYHGGTNWILAGGSSFTGVERAVACLCAEVATHGQPQELSLPRLLQVELEPSLAERLSHWPQTVLGRPVPTNPTDLLTAIGPYTMMYAWTAEERYLLHARDCLRALNATHQGSYGDWHYLIERLVRAFPLLAASGCLDPSEVLYTEQTLLGTACETADMWWRMRDGTPPLGHRHHGKGTYSFYLLARLLRTAGAPSAAAANLLERWLSECGAFMDALCAARSDDQDDESTHNNLGSLVWYALGEERYNFFESGAARVCAERAIALHDNRGQGAGAEGYAEGIAGAWGMTWEVAPMAAAAAFYYGDGQLKSALQQIPALQENVGWSLSPWYVHCFATGESLPAAEPTSLTGLRRLPLSQYQHGIYTHPPEHVEPMGHSVNAPETWLRQGGVGDNHLPLERTYDKLVFRGGLAPADPYLLLQGISSAWRWQGAMQAANAIVRFAQGGHVFLIQNTDHQTYSDKNAVLVSNGFNDSLLPPLAECVGTVDDDVAALSVTRLCGYRGTAWTRHVFWSRPGDGYFVVVDSVEAQETGEYSVTCTWRTPAYAELNGRVWQSRQGDSVFRLCPGRHVPVTSEEQGHQGACNPYVLRQRQGGSLHRQDIVAFENLFYVRQLADEATLDLLTIAPGTVLVVDGRGKPQAWCATSRRGASLHLGALRVRGASAMVSAANTNGSGARVHACAAVSLELQAGDGYRIEADTPVSLCLAVHEGMLTVAAGTAEARVTVHCGRCSTELRLATGEKRALAVPECTWHWQEAIASPVAVVSAAVPAANSAVWPVDWESAALTPRPTRLRQMAVYAEPEPVNGGALQLIDTVFTEWRRRQQLYPAAEEYSVRLAFAEPRSLGSLRLVGDSHIQPLTQAFEPLPDTIEVVLSDDGFAEDVRRWSGGGQPDEVVYPRFTGWDDRYEARHLPLGTSAREVAIRLKPSPGRCLVLQEIEAFSTGAEPPAMVRLETADLDGDGRLEAVAVGAGNEVVALSGDGSVLWRYQVDGRINCCECLDLDGDGRHQVCMGISGNVLLILDGKGTVRRRIAYGEMLQNVDDLHFGQFRCINGLGIWRREADGRACMLIGAYALSLFADADGSLLGHCWGDGSYQDSILATPVGGPQPWDLWVRNRWNHGISVYEGLDGLAPSGEGQVFGGLRQPMFRGLRRVLPFVAGSTIAFRWLGPADHASGRILAATEHGLGIILPAQRQWAWQVLGGSPLTACVAGGSDPDSEVITASLDGFVASFRLANGAPLRRHLFDAPVRGVAPRPDGAGLVVATEREVAELDADWRVTRTAAFAATRLGALGHGQYVVGGKSGQVARFSTS